MIELKELNLQLEIGFGENHFSMKRGSFNYKQKISKRRKLVLKDKGVLGNGYRLTYQDTVTNREYMLDIQDNKGVISVLYRGNLEEKINRYWITFSTNPKERIYGCGETYSKFNLKGEKVRIWVAEHQNASRITNKIIKSKLFGKRPNKKLNFEKYESYYAQPTFVSSDKYFVHVNTNAYSEFDFRKSDKITLYFQDRPNFIISKANNFTELSKRISGLLGKQKQLPEWIYDGAILAIQEGCKAVDDKIEIALKSGAKIAGVWCQDWSGCRKTKFGYQVMWNWEWDKELYPDLDKKIIEWRAKGIHFLGYINPFIAIEKNIYQEAAQKGYCVKDKNGEDYLVTITTFPAAMIDFTNPEAYEWYKNIIKENMIQIGMSGWMADFGEYLPLDSVLYSKENPIVLHNRWPAIWAKMNQEAILESNKEKEIFFFTRAGHTETIKNSSMMWTGDQHVDWSMDDGLPSVIPATLSLAMSGYGITHSDAGGYTTIMNMRRTKELLMRWEEMNVFSPLLRTHEGNQPINNVQFDDDQELLIHFVKCSKMHAALKGYLQKYVMMEQEYGTPVIRPLFYHYEEELAYDETTEYLLGKDILVAPVVKEGRLSRDCYLPKDSWVHLFTGKEFTGGLVEIDAPMGQPPVFIRKDSEDYEQLMQIAEL